MMLKLPDNFSLGDLLSFVKQHDPATIVMTQSQYKTYAIVVGQHDHNARLSFMRKPIIVLE